MKKRGEKSAVTMSRLVHAPGDSYSQQHQTSPATGSPLDEVAADSYLGSHATSAFSPASSCGYSLSAEDPKRNGQAGHVPAKSSNSKPRWLKNVKDWLSVSEPSAQALKHQRVSTYQRHGVALDDPDAAAKMHLPIGRVPDGVTTSSAGPDPEKTLQDRAIRGSAKHQYMQHTGSQSRSSGVSSRSNPSIKEANKIAPWLE
jgi:hypothetical protein